MTDIIPPWYPAFTNGSGLEVPSVAGHLYWVGTAPYLDTADQDVSYGYNDGTVVGTPRTGVVIPPWSPAAGVTITAARIEGQQLNTDNAFVAWQLVNRGAGGGTPTTLSLLQVNPGPAGAWVTYTNVIDPVDLPSVLSTLAIDGLTLTELRPSTGASQLSRLQLILTGPSLGPNLTAQLLEPRVRFWGK